MPERRGASIRIEEHLGRALVLGHDPGRQRRRLLVRDPNRLLDPVDEVDRDGRNPLGIARPVVAERDVERLATVPADVQAAPAQELDQLG